MSGEDDVLMAVALVCALDDENKIVKKRKWSKDWYLKRDQLSHTNLISELKNEPSDYLNYLRMDIHVYSELLELITPIISKKNTLMRKSITPHERLSATLRYLATGMNYEDLKFPTAISPQALGQIIPETCSAILKVLQKQYVKVSVQLHLCNFAEIMNKYPFHFLQILN